MKKKKFQKLYEIKYLFLLLIISFLLRVIGINERDLWLDECTSVFQASLSPITLIKKLAGGVHPPLFHLTLHYWMKIFGKSPLAVRSMSVFFGLIFIIVIYFVGKNLFNHKVGITTAFLITFSPFFIWYSQDARMYIILFTWASLSFYFGYKLLEEKKLSYWALYIIFTILMIFTSYFGFLLIMVQNIFFVVWIIRINSRKLDDNLSENINNHKRELKLKKHGRLRTAEYWISSQITILILFYPWIKLVLDMRELAGIAGEHLLGGEKYNFNDIIMVIVQSIFGFHSDITTANIVSLWPLLLIVIFILVFIYRPPDMKFIYLILGTFVPIVFMYIVGFYRELFLVRYISVFTIPFYLMIGCFISSIYERVNFNRLMLSIVLIFLICWVDQSYNPNNRIRYDTGRAITYVEDNLKYQDGIIYIPYYMKNIFIYYYDGSVEPISIPRVEPKTFSLRMTKAEIRNDLKIAYKGKKRMWLITSFEEREFAKTISFRARVILRNKYSEEKRKDYANVSVYLFSK